MSEKCAVGKPDVSRFKNLVRSNTESFNEKCAKWTSLLDDTPDISDEARGQIRSVIGQANLLMDQRFKQFNGLIRDCEFKLGERETTCTDLEGFWDMIYFQVEDVNFKFSSLDELKNNNWKAVDAVQVPKKVVKTLKAKKKGLEAKSAMNSHILLARERLKLAKARGNKENKVFEAPGFFTVSSPIKSTEIGRNHSNCTPLKLRSASNRKLLLSPTCNGND